MKNILISYDLKSPGQRYADLRDLIKRTFPTYWACLESTFIIRTDQTCAQVRDLCKSVLDSNDKLLVIEVGSNWATRNMAGECSDWLRNNVGS